MPITVYPVTVDHEELEGSPVENSSMSDFTATRILKCAWADRLQLMDELLTGYEITVGNPTIGIITSTIGQQYPWRNGVYVQSVSIQQFGNVSSAAGGDTTLAAWEYAQLTVQYAPRNFDATASNSTSNLAAGVAEESLDPAVEIVQAPNTAPVYFEDSSTLIPGNNRPAKLIRLLNWTFSLPRVKSIPAGWGTYQGYINSAAVTSTSLGRTFDAGTLLYGGYRARRSFFPQSQIFQQAGGVFQIQQAQRAWDVQLMFTYRPAGWNKFPNFEGVFKRLYNGPSNTGGQVKPYDQEADFNSVLIL